MEWMPIETAPIGKTIICAWMGAPDCHVVSLAHHVVGGVLKVEAPESDYWCNPDDCRDQFATPDYWMPLPPPPTDRRAPEVE